MNNFKKDLACNITLIVVLAFTITHLLILTLSLFGVTSLVFFDGFNYLVAYPIVIVCLVLYVVSFFTYKFTNLYMPAWFRILFYVAFFLFTNTYYICGWFQNTYALVFFFAYVSFLVNVIALSVFFNTQKNDKNKLKVTPGYLITSVFLFSVAINALIQFVINIVKLLAFKNYIFTTLSAWAIEFSSMLIVTILMTIVFAISLAHSKTLINNCLIKMNNTSKKELKSE